VPSVPAVITPRGTNAPDLTTRPVRVAGPGGLVRDQVRSASEGCHEVGSVGRNVEGITRQLRMAVSAADRRPAWRGCTAGLGSRTLDGRESGRG
jgi:hypothetical protein